MSDKLYIIDDKEAHNPSAVLKAFTHKVGLRGVGFDNIDAKKYILKICKQNKTALPTHNITPDEILDANRRIVDTMNEQKRKNDVRIDRKCLVTLHAKGTNDCDSDIQLDDVTLSENGIKFDFTEYIGDSTKCHSVNVVGDKSAKVQATNSSAINLTHCKDCGIRFSIDGKIVRLHQKEANFYYTMVLEDNVSSNQSLSPAQLKTTTIGGCGCDYRIKDRKDNIYMSLEIGNENEKEEEDGGDGGDWEDWEDWEDEEGEEYKENEESRLARNLERRERHIKASIDAFNLPKIQSYINIASKNVAKHKDNLMSNSSLSSKMGLGIQNNIGIKAELKEESNQFMRNHQVNLDLVMLEIEQKREEVNAMIETTIASMEAEKSKFERIKQLLQAELNKVDSIYVLFENQILEYNEHIVRANNQKFGQEYEEKMSQVRGMSTELEELTSKINTVIEEAESKQEATVSEMQGQIARMQTELATLEQEKEDIDKKISEAKAEIQQAMSASNNLENDATETPQDVEDEINEHVLSAQLKVNEAREFGKGVTTDLSNLQRELNEKTEAYKQQVRDKQIENPLNKELCETLEGQSQIQNVGGKFNELKMSGSVAKVSAEENLNSAINCQLHNLSQLMVLEARLKQKKKPSRGDL